jgi:hypothetical protein
LSIQHSWSHWTYEVVSYYKFLNTDPERNTFWLSSVYRKITTPCSVTGWVEFSPLGQFFTKLLPKNNEMLTIFFHFQILLKFFMKYHHRLFNVLDLIWWFVSKTIWSHWLSVNMYIPFLVLVSFEKRINYFYFLVDINFWNLQPITRHATSRQMWHSIWMPGAGHCNIILQCRLLMHPVSMYIGTYIGTYAYIFSSYPSTNLVLPWKIWISWYHTQFSYI